MTELSENMPKQLVSSGPSNPKLFCIVQRMKNDGLETSVNGVRMLLTDTDVLVNSLNVAREHGEHLEVEKFREEAVYTRTSVEDAIRKLLQKNEEEKKKMKEEFERENRALLAQIIHFKAIAFSREPEAYKDTVAATKIIAKAKEALEIANQKDTILKQILAESQ